MTIHQKFTGDASQLLKEYQTLTKEVARNEQQLAKLAGEFGVAGAMGMKAGSALNSMLRQGADEIKNYTQQWTGLSLVLHSVTAELDEIADKQQRAASTNVSVGSSQADIIRNLPGVSSDQKRDFLNQTQDAFAKSQFGDLNQFNRAVASGLSASSGDMEGTLKAALAGAQLTRDKPEDLDLLVGAALDVAKASGTKDAEKNLGFMLQVGGESRMTDTKSTAVTVPPAIIAAVNTMKGDRQQTAIDAGAVFAALGSQGGDVTGKSTSTSVTSLAVQMRDYFEKGTEKTINGRKVRLKPKDDPGTFEGRISFLQENEKERKRFLENASFERQFQVPVEQLLTKGSETDAQFRSSRSKLSFDDAEYKQQVKDLQTLTPATSMASIDAAAKGQLQLAELGNTREARISKAREIRDKALREARGYSPQMAGLKFVTDKGEDLYDYSKAGEGRDPVQDALNRVERRRRDVLQPGSLLGGRDNFAYARKPEDLNADEKRVLAFLEQQIALLKQLVEQENEAKKAVDDQTEVIRNSQRAPVGTVTAAARAERGGHREQ